MQKNQGVSSSQIDANFLSKKILEQSYTSSRSNPKPYGSGQPKSSMLTTRMTTYRRYASLVSSTLLWAYRLDMSWANLDAGLTLRWFVNVQRYRPCFFEPTGFCDPDSRWSLWSDVPLALVVSATTLYPMMPERNKVRVDWSSWMTQNACSSHHFRMPVMFLPLTSINSSRQRPLIMRCSSAVLGPLFSGPLRTKLAITHRPSVIVWSATR